MSLSEKRRSEARSYQPLVVRSDPRVCNVCRKSGAVWWPILNSRSGKYHSGGDYGVTDCGVDATADHWVWPL